MDDRGDADGWHLLGSDRMGRLLQAVLATEGARLLAWTLDQVDRSAGRSTTAAYLVTAQWPGRGEQEELIAVTARAGGPDEADRRARLFTEQGREVVAWRYPDDPELTGLTTAAYPSAVAALLNERQLVPGQVGAADVELTMVTYRPRRRAVVQADLPRLGLRFFLKVLRPDRVATVLARHRLLRDHHIPAPEVVAVTGDSVVVTPALPGAPLSAALFGPGPPLGGHQLVDLLDALPPAVAALPRREPWSSHVSHYAEQVAAALPDEAPRVARLASTIEAGLAGIAPGDEPTHGDFHEQQVFVHHNRISGLLDIDTIGPGRRVDDLACLLAHVSTVQGLNQPQAGRLSAVLADWVPVFDRRVDPAELRLRTAAVAISLATGPFRGQEPDWPVTTRRILATAQAWLAQLGS